MNEFNGREREYTMIRGGLQEVTKTVAQAVVQRTRRGFCSEGEQWAAILENLEQAEVSAKRAKTLHKELWDAIKAGEQDAYMVTMQEFERQAEMLAAQWAYINMLTIQEIEVT